MKKLIRKKDKWWEKEAEEQGLTLEQYISTLKLKKENAELELTVLNKKEEKRSRREKWDDYQAEQFEALKETVKGYEEVAKLHSAYIAFLLRKLGATEGAPVIIRDEDIKHSIEHLEARAIPKSAGVWAFYCEEAKE